MDLFDDLPEPENGKNEEASEHCKEESSALQSGSDSKGIKRKLEDCTSESSSKNATSSVYEVCGFFAEKKGEREEMQDRHTLIEDFHTHIPGLDPSVSRISYFAVFDGHGGARASRFASDHLHLNLAQKFPKGPLPQIEREIKRTFVDVFKKTDEEFLRLATQNKPSWKDGTTAIVVLLLQNDLYIANLGDSKAVLCRYREELGKHVSVPLSSDHSPTEYNERMRIQKAGGHVRDGRVMGVLEVSRSLGDGQYKSLGVSPLPDVRRCPLLLPRDPFLLLACDGLWKVIDAQEVVDIVLSCTQDGSDEICYETACNKLVTEAIRRHSGDNVTVLIVAFRNTPAS